MIKKSPLIIIGLLFLINLTYISAQDNIVACTMDAKICPDGTAVGRVGPNCEFQECPTRVSPSQPGNDGLTTNSCDAYWEGYVYDSKLAKCVLKGASGCNDPFEYDTLKECESQKACPEDAKICSDGSTVVRKGPNCEFQECPSIKTSPPSVGEVVCTMDAVQCPDGTYVGRTGPNCEFVCPGTVSNQDITTIYNPNTKKVEEIVMKSELISEDSKTYMNTSAGKKEIKLSANQAVTLSNVSIIKVELKEESKTAVYIVEGKKEVKVFGVFNAHQKVRTTINAETGEIINTVRPWWGFLAKEKK